jgi:hypothetical protein
MRSGGVYNATHVRTLEAMVSRHLPYLDRFVCLTDSDFLDPHVECIGLVNHWPGWWSKLELFSKRVAPEGSRVLYFDLDMVITGSLVEIAARPEPFIVKSDTYRNGIKSPRHLKGRPGYQSSMMAWTAGELEYLYTDFARTAPTHMTKHKAIGDQEFLEFHAPRAAYWDDVAPGQVVSFRRHCREGLPADARVVDFHGKMKPWLADDAWIAEHYRIGERL